VKNLNIDELFNVVRMPFGSYLYGTNTPTSDRDYKGIFLPDKEMIFLGKIPKSYNLNTKQDPTQKNTVDDVDQEIYSLHYFIKLACEGQTGPIDMLHCPKNMLIATSEIWDYIVQNKHKFYTKNLSAFVGYARSQAAKYGIKGSRLNDTKKVVDFLSGCKPTERMSDVWDNLPEGEHIHKLNPNEIGRHGSDVLLYQVCGRCIQATAKTEYALDIVNKFYENYGKRAEMAAKNLGIDWKAVSHAIRAAIQIKDIFTTGTIEYPLVQADYLKQVKAGQLSYKDEVGPTLEAMMDEIEQLSRESDLPEKSDRRFWDNFIMEVIDEYVL